MEKGKFPQYKDVDGVRVAEVVSSEAVRSALAYVPLDEDMFVVTFPKCGTTWTQAIVLLILNKGKPFKNIGEFFKRSPFLEMCGAEAAAMMPRPGVLKLHLTYEQTPQNSKAKYIYVVRNPKDTCVSFYYHTKGWALYGFTGSFSDFFDIFYKGENDFGEYFEHVMSWYKHRDDPNVLFILYEDLKKDTKGMVMKIAKFLGPEWEKLLIDEPQVLEDVLKYSSINEMKQMVKAQDLVAASQSEENVPQGLRHIASQMANVGAGSLMKDFEFVRKGVVGDWKNHFTEEQAKKLDDKTRELASVSAMSSFEQRENIKFCVKFKKYFIVTLALMNEAYEDEKLSRTQVCFWYKRFKDGRKSIAVDSRSGRPLTSTTDRNIGRVGFEVLEHPAYSPDLAPSDYFLFGLLKKELKGKRFDSDEDVQKVVQDFFHTLPKSAYKKGIYKLPERWRRSIEGQ
ncbi:hypothetical protein LAZ67_4004062, partial [Cordylochernes scorpioides]